MLCPSKQLDKNKKCSHFIHSWCSVNYTKSATASACTLIFCNLLYANKDKLAVLVHTSVIKIQLFNFKRLCHFQICSCINMTHFATHPTAEKQLMLIQTTQIMNKWITRILIKCESLCLFSNPDWVQSSVTLFSINRFN